MPLTPFQLVFSGVILYLALLLQSAVGFGAGMFVIPLLIWSGVSLPDAIVLLTSVVLIQCAVGAYSLRAEIVKKDVCFATAFRYLGIVLGVFLLTKLANLDKELLKQFVGLVVLSVLALQSFLRIQPREHLHPAWGVFAFSVSGLMAGMIGMGGPPVILWLLAKSWSSQKARAFLFSIFLLAVPFLMLMFYLSFGPEILRVGLIGFLLAPLAAHASSLGVAVGNKMSKERFRKVAITLLVCIAVSSILAPLLK